MRKYVCLAVILIGISVFCEAQTAQFKPFTSFRTIKTERFDIIFPKESEPSARLLASYADNVYDQVSGLLGIQVRGRIPVCLTPHTELFNGYYNPVFHPHIMLFDTPMDLEWTNFANNLESLFLHELTHAVSLNSRKPFNRFMHAVFGNWVVPASVNAYPFMIEGVTVSFESLTGMGRANDPLVKQNVRQAIYENKFLTPFQASGVYDLPTHGSPYYEYGGLFSAWLQHTYGMEKYAELWQEMGDAALFSFFVYKSGYYRIFKKVYGIDFLVAWNAFRDSLALDGIEENDDNVLPPKKHFFSERRNSITGLAANGNNVFILDHANRKIHIYDTLGANIRNIDIDALSSTELDVSPDGSKVLISGYRYAADRSFATVTEHRTSNGWKIGGSIKGVYKARYFRDGVIGIGAELHNNCIVFVTAGGKKEILFRGNERLVFSGPQALDDERIVFVAARDGIRELWLYNYLSGELSRIESANNDWQHYMRGLGVSDGKIFCSYNADDRMYKLAAIDLATMQAHLSKRDFSGGVFNPVAVDNAIYYRGAFFAQDYLLRYPEPIDSLSGDVVGLHLTPLDRQSYVPITEKNGAVTDSNEPVTKLLYQGQTKPYIGIAYMNPFRFWLPLPLLRLQADGEDKFALKLDGGGLITLVNDPTEQNLVALLAYADARYQMAKIELLQWQNTTLGFPLKLVFSDTVVEDDIDFLYRDTRATLSGSFSWNMGQWNWGFSPAALYARIAGDNDDSCAYEWEKIGDVFALTAGIAFSNNHRLSHELFGTGLHFSFIGASVVSGFEPHVEGIFQASVETRFPLRLTLFGAYDEMGMNLHGVSYRYGSSSISEVALTEYPTVGLNLHWLSGAEASIGLFSIETQGNKGHVYYNRLFGILSLRNVIYDSQGNPFAEGVAINNLRLAQSLVYKQGMKISFFPVVKQPFYIEPVFWWAWKFSNSITGKGDPLYQDFNLGLNLNF